MIGMFQNLINGGDTDVGLVKYDAAGNEVFTILYDSTATLRAGSVTTGPGRQHLRGPVQRDQQRSCSCPSTHRPARWCGWSTT